MRYFLFLLPKSFCFLFVKFAFFFFSLVQTDTIASENKKNNSLFALANYFTSLKHWFFTTVKKKKKRKETLHLCLLSPVLILIRNYQAFASCFYRIEKRKMNNFILQLQLTIICLSRKRNIYFWIYPLSFCYSLIELWLKKKKKNLQSILLLSSSGLIMFNVRTFKVQLFHHTGNENCTKLSSQKVYCCIGKQRNQKVWKNLLSPTNVF